MGELDATDGAELDSSGVFTVDAERAGLKRAGRVYPTPAHWLLRWVQLAHLAHAREVRLRWGARSTEAVWLTYPESPGSEAEMRDGLSELVSALEEDSTAEVRWTETKVTIVVRRPWRRAFDRLPEIALVLGRCGFSELPILLDGQPLQPRVMPSDPLVKKPGPVWKRAPAWLSEYRCGEWPARLLKPPAVLERPLTRDRRSAFLALRGSLHGDNTSWPVQHGVTLEPVRSRMAPMGLSLVWNAQGLPTDASGFRLVEGKELKWVQRDLIAQTGVMLRWTSDHLARAARAAPPLKSPLRALQVGAVAGGLGFAVFGPVGALVGAVGGVGLGANSDWEDLLDFEHKDLNEAWKRRLQELELSLPRD